MIKLNKLKKEIKYYSNIFRIKPDTFIAGFQKCGTTSLYNYLIQSKKYIGGNVKENDKLLENSNFLNKFLSEYPFQDLKRKKTLCASHQIAFNPKGIERLKIHFPNAKFVFIMRNPVERAISRYLFNQKKFNAIIDKKFTKNFDSLVEDEIKILKEIQDITNIEEIYKKIGEINPYGLPVSRGIYYPYVKRFLDYNFQCHFLSLENLNNNFSHEFYRLCEFLEIDYFEPEPIVYNSNNSISKNLLNINPETIEKLINFYEPYNQKLFNLINVNYNW